MRITFKSIRGTHINKRKVLNEMATSLEEAATMLQMKK
jgi:hypothetical protein